MDPMALSENRGLSDSIGSSSLSNRPFGRVYLVVHPTYKVG